MVKHQYVVGRQANIELDAVGTLFSGSDDGFDRVLGMVGRRAAMGDHPGLKRRWGQGSWVGGVLGHGESLADHDRHATNGESESTFDLRQDLPRLAADVRRR